MRLHRVLLPRSSKTLTDMEHLHRPGHPDVDGTDERCMGEGCRAGRESPHIEASKVGREILTALSSARVTDTLQRGLREGSAGRGGVTRNGVKDGEKMTSVMLSG